MHASHIPLIFLHILTDNFQNRPYLVIVHVSPRICMQLHIRTRVHHIYAYFVVVFTFIYWMPLKANSQTWHDYDIYILTNVWIAIYRCNAWSDASSFRVLKSLISWKTFILLTEVIVFTKFSSIKSSASSAVA